MSQTVNMNDSSAKHLQSRNQHLLKVCKLPYKEINNKDARAFMAMKDKENDSQVQILQ